VTYAYLVGRQIVNIIFMHWYERSLSILGQAFQVVSVQFPYLLNSCPIMKDVSKIILQCIVASANSSRRSAPNFSGETVSEGSLLASSPVWFSPFALGQHLHSASRSSTPVTCRKLRNSNSTVSNQQRRNRAFATVMVTKINNHGARLAAFTLVEVMIGVVILAVGFASLYLGFSHGLPSFR